MIRKPIHALVAVLVTGSLAQAATATDRDKFERKVSRIAPLAGAKGKALCYCVNQAQATFENRVGYIRHVVLNNQVHVQCAGDLFDSGGTDLGGFSCTDFRPLVK